MCVCVCVSEKKTKMEKDRNKIAEDMVSVVLHLMKTSNWSYSHVSVCSQWEVKGLKATRSGMPESTQS